MNSLRNFDSVFQSVCTNLLSHQLCTGFPFLHILQQLLPFVFFRVAILVGVKWRCLLSVVLFILAPRHVGS